MAKKFTSNIKSTLALLVILGGLILFSPLPQSYKNKVYSLVEDLFNEYEKTPTDCLRVSHVVDGDTIDIINENGVKERIRLIGIDAFETRENDRLKKQMKEYGLTKTEVVNKGNEAKKYLEGKFSKSNNRYKNNNNTYCVYIVREGKDKYGRTLAEVYYEFNKEENNIQQDLLNQGFVEIY